MAYGPLREKMAMNTVENGFPANKLNPMNLISCLHEVARLHNRRESQQRVNLI